MSLLTHDPIFANRHEVKHILSLDAERPARQIIGEISDNSSAKKELLVTTYFEPILNKSDDLPVVARFRQRFTQEAYPDKWVLVGPGNFEVKQKHADLRSTKLGVYLSDKDGIYTLMRAANAGAAKLIQLVESIHPHEFDRALLRRAAKSLVPYCTRVNVRETFSISGSSLGKITLDTKTVYYAYPIAHRVGNNPVILDSYEADLSEKSQRIKIEFKSTDMNLVKETEAKFQKVISQFSMGSIMTHLPYSEMIIQASKKTGVLVREETWDREIEAKASIVGADDPLPVIVAIREALIQDPALPYQVFITENQVKARGEEEMDRTIFGWRDQNGVWQEVVTATRLTEAGRKMYGSTLRLKWKGNSTASDQMILDRPEMKENIKDELSDDEIVEMSEKKTGRNIQIIGKIRKSKYRVKVQDRDGRNYGLSVDKVTILESGETMMQMEAEYVDTVLLPGERLSETFVGEACVTCIEFFIGLLEKFGIRAVKTSLRKIDFLGQLS